MQDTAGIVIFGQESFACFRFFVIISSLYDASPLNDHRTGKDNDRSWLARWMDDFFLYVCVCKPSSLAAAPRANANNFLTWSEVCLAERRSLMV